MLETIKRFLLISFACATICMLLSDNVEGKGGRGGGGGRGGSRGGSHVYSGGGGGSWSFIDLNSKLIFILLVIFSICVGGCCCLGVWACIAVEHDERFKSKREAQEKKMEIEAR